MSSQEESNFCIHCGAPLQEGAPCENCSSKIIPQPYVKPKVFSRKNQKRILVANIIVLIISVALAIIILLGRSRDFSHSFIISTILDINPAFVISVIVIQLLGFIFNIIIITIGVDKILKKFNFLNENILYAMWMSSAAIGVIFLSVIGGIAVIMLIGVLICVIIMR
ncbi:MAG: hypothetical protein KAS63_01060 [Candidatus Heimdallarchaeota archaeon]|nr:hypothetical protein [Candidatus Heimdallarchaeota archaeon]MCK4953932.1 hypothetical protein [Candidatus Heimdallarchaeota archaeon]